MRHKPSYLRAMTLPNVLAATLLAATGCQTSTLPAEFDCPETTIAQWQIPAGSLDRSLTPEQAYTLVLTGNLPIDGIRDRWQQLEDQRQNGDQFWSYMLEDGQLVNDIGGQEGVVLIRGCRQLGYVATSVGLTKDPSTPTR